MWPAIANTFCRSVPLARRVAAEELTALRLAIVP
jgi:hypothetical protein